jgi:dTMP kinase
MERGLLIAVEGIDKSGKETQVDELAKNFIMAGEEVITIDFPAYDTPSGQAIRSILDGYHPLDARENAMELQALMAINRYEQQARIETALMQGKVVICDRYVASGQVYGVNAGVDMDWLSQIQHALVQPDITVLLNITEEEYVKRCKNYDELDVHESDLSFIRSAIKLYNNFGEMNEDWLVIDGAGSEEDIANNVFSSVQKVMKEMGLE